MLLLGSMVTAIPTALADGSDTASEELRYKAEALIQLLNQTMEKVNATLRFLNTTLGGLAPEAYERYQAALELYGNATRLYEEGNYTEAIRLSFKTLQMFKLCLKAAVGVEETGAYRRLKAALWRLNLTIERVERARNMLLRAFSSLEANITGTVDPLIEEARQLAEEADQALEAGNVSGAAALIGRAHAKAAQALAAMNRIVNSKFIMALRIRHYIKICFARFAARARHRARRLGISLDDLLEEAEKELEDAMALTGKGHLGLAKAKILSAKAKIQGILNWLERHRRENHGEHPGGRGRHGRP